MVSSSRIRYGLAGLTAVAALCALNPVPARAQDTTRGLSSTLLRRVAEVVDARSAGADVFVVAARGFPHDVFCVPNTRREADACAARRPGSLVLGPFRVDVAARFPKPPEVPEPVDTTEIIEELEKMFRGGGCLHATNSDYRDGRGEICGYNAVAIRDVASIRITTQMRDGSSNTVTLSPDSVDAVFLTLDALDKFLLPYYARVYGVTYAATIRAGIVERLRR